MAAEATATIEPLDERGTSAVRFETQCVVIPDSAHRSRLPRVVTKSYTLPLWKRRTAASEDTSFNEENQSQLVLRVPLPTISLKPHSVIRAVDQTPLPPCLVHRQSTSPSFPTSPLRNRHAHTRRTPSPSPSRPDIITVPLRPCCTACQFVTEAALNDGDAWPEHFSRAASRQRSMSVDGSPRTITVAGSAASASYGALGVSISVDEVDKRRRASDTDTLWSKKEHCRNGSSSSFVADASFSRMMPTTPRIPEEEDDDDENELFPLPSPKRTPSTSPAGSLSSLMVTQRSRSSGASPTPSSCSVDVTTKRHFLAPPPCASSSSLSLPKPSESTTDLDPGLVEDPPRTPSPQFLSALPSLSGRHHSMLPSRMMLTPPTPTNVVSATDSTPTETPQNSEPVSTPRGLPQSSSPSSPIQTRLPWRPKHRVSVDVDTPESSFTGTPVPLTTPPASPPTHSKKSFSISNPIQVFTDVLRGVGAIGSGSGGIPTGISV